MDRRLMPMLPEKVLPVEDGRTCYKVPDTKLRNVLCVVCQRKFFMPDITFLKGMLSKKAQIPLLFRCGHPVCDKCVKVRSITNCPLCQERITDNGPGQLLPLNLYALGVIVSSYNSPLVSNEDEDFTFCHKISTQLRQISKQGSCQECGKQANVKCLQCVALYCYQCYSKIHGRALQSHTHISIHENGPDSPANILNSCSPQCSEALSYYCNECNVAACSNCTLNLHKLHKFVSLEEKNRHLLPEFEKTCNHIEETLLRVSQEKEKVESVLKSNTYKLQNLEDVEASITQHFTHLHGVLQNLEARMLNELHQRCNDLKNNLEDIVMQLRSQEETLKITLQMASYTKQMCHKVDIQNAIQVLQESTDLPCFLIYKDNGQANKAAFNIDDSIVTAVENHCTIQIPPLASYYLARMDELPKNYKISTMMKSHRVTSKTVGKPTGQQLMLMPPPDKSSNNILTTSSKSEDKENVPECNVEISCIVNPSLFYVQKIADKSKFLQLERDLMEHEKDRKNVAQPIDLKENDMCVIKEKMRNKWYRGRVNAVTERTTNGDDYCKTYSVFYIDYGKFEDHVPPSRLRYIAEHLQELPPRAIRCSLHGVLPKNSQWTSASITDFIKLTHETDCSISMIVTKALPDKQFVDLCVSTTKNNNMGPQSVCSAMVNMNHARLKTNKPAHNVCKPDKQTYVYNREELMLNKFTKVLVQYVASPDQIYVMKLGQHREKLTKLLEDLNDYYKKLDSPKTIVAPEVGLPCTVEMHNIWHRAEIIEVLDEDRVTIFCVDSGYSFTVHKNALREIPYHYTTYKRQAIRMSLMYIMPKSDGTWKSQASDELFNIFCDAECLAANPRKKIKDGYIGCMLADSIDVSRRLKAAGVVDSYPINMIKKTEEVKKSASSSSPSSSQSEQLNASLKDSYYDAENDKSEKIEKDKTTSKDPFKVEVMIRRVVTPYSIYVAEKERERSNAAFISEMQKFYNTYHATTMDNWCEGAVCAVYSAKDKAYLRAKILKINSPRDVLVYFSDMGIEETVTLKDIQVLNGKFAQEPAYFFKVKLAGILPCGGSSTWPLLSCSTLVDIIQENASRTFYIAKLVHEDVYDDPVPIELWVRQTRIPGPFLPATIEINSINRMLVDKGVALPIKNYFSKAVSVLATELKRQLANNREFLSAEEETGEVKWLKKALLDVDKNLDDTATSLRSDSLNCNNDIDTFLSEAMKYKNSALTECKRPMKFSDWLPSVEITEEVFYAIPTYVNDNCAVYLHPKKYNADMLLYIQTELQAHCKSIKVKEGKQWNEGDICLAQYHHDKKWYRGRVVKNMGNILQVEFIDYGNVEECELQCVTDNVRLGHIPIQCTKCIISGLKPDNPTGKWMLHDLDRIHALLVDQQCKVTILQREPTYLVISIMLLRPWKCDLLLYLTNHMDMNIKVESKEWNDGSQSSGIDDFKSNSTADVIIEEIIDDEKDTMSILNRSLSELNMQSATLNENMISGNLAITEVDDDKGIYNLNVSWMDAISLDKEPLDKPLISSTPQRQSDDDSFFGAYERLRIPPETKYIEIMLCCNKDPVTCYAQLARNEDTMFHSVFGEYYLQYNTIMEELQVQASSQPLIQSFEKNTPCISKFSDGTWYRCIIARSEKISNSSCVQVSLHYVDYGNYEYRMLNSLTDHGLHVPKQMWLAIPAIAFKCTFWGLKFVDSDVDLLATKLNKVYNQAVVAKIKEIIDEKDLVAEIYTDKTCKELLYEHLIREGVYQLKKSKED